MDEAIVEATSRSPSYLDAPLGHLYIFLIVPTLQRWDKEFEEYMRFEGDQ